MACLFDDAGTICVHLQRVQTSALVACNTMQLGVFGTVLSLITLHAVCS